MAGQQPGGGTFCARHGSWYERETMITIPHSRREWFAAIAALGAGHAFGQTAPRSSLTLATEIVADRRIPTGQYKHPAAITELANGDLYLAWYGGDGEYAANTGVYGVRLAAKFRNSMDGRRWTSPVLLARDPFRSVGNPVVWQAPARDARRGWYGSSMWCGLERPGRPLGLQPKSPPMAPVPGAIRH